MINYTLKYDKITNQVYNAPSKKKQKKTRNCYNFQTMTSS